MQILEIGNNIKTDLKNLVVHNLGELHFTLDQKVGFTTLHTEEHKFISNKKFAIKLLRPNLLRD